MILSLRPLLVFVLLPHSIALTTLRILFMLFVVAIRTVILFGLFNREACLTSFCTVALLKEARYIILPYHGVHAIEHHIVVVIEVDPEFGLPVSKQQ